MKKEMESPQPEAWPLAVYENRRNLFMWHTNIKWKLSF